MEPLNALKTLSPALQGPTQRVEYLSIQPPKTQPVKATTPFPFPIHLDLFHLTPHTIKQSRKQFQIPYSFNLIKGKELFNYAMLNFHSTKPYSNMSHKRKRSISESTSSSTSSFNSPPSVSNFPSPFARMEASPSHLHSRTLKRFRDSRPSENEVHRKTWMTPRVA